MSDFCNNLRKDDPVSDAETKRPGKVAAGVRENSRTVSVLFQGASKAVRVDVMRLRLVVDGVPEENAPVDGEPPAKADKSAPALAGESSAVRSMRAERAKIADELTEIEARFKVLRSARDRLDKAIAILTGSDDGLSPLGAAKGAA